MYSSNSPPPPNLRFGKATVQQMEAMVSKLQFVGSKRDKTAAQVTGSPPNTPTTDMTWLVTRVSLATLLQVAVNYVASNGVIPVVGIRSLEHATELAGAIDWRLTAEEIAMLESVGNVGSANHSWQHG